MSAPALAVVDADALTIPETAQRLRVGRSTVYRLIASGALTTTDVSSRGRPRLRVEPSAVAAFLAKRRLAA